MFKVLKLLFKALVKRTIPLTSDVLESCQRLQQTDDYFKIDYANYQLYHLAVDWPDEFLHPCYLQMAALPLQLDLLLHPQSPFKPLGLVHIHNHITQYSHIERGQPFALHCGFGGVYRHRKGVAFEVVVTAEQQGELVYRATGTYLQRRAILEQEMLADASHLPLVKEELKRPRRELTKLILNSGAGRAYASISRDYNPIHLCKLFARLLGFPQALAHGMYTLACGVSKEEHVLDFRPPDMPIEVSCDFFKPVFLPASMAVRSAPHKMDRLIFLSDKAEDELMHLIIQYNRGEAARLHRAI